MPKLKRFCYVDDCGKPAHGHGLCSQHYQRWKRYGRTYLLRNQPKRQVPRGPLPQSHSRKDWIIWAAGFFDGEGCIYIQHRKRTNVYFLKAAVVQKDIGPLRILQALFGGSVNTRKTAPAMWSITTRMAESALKELLPHLVVKRQQADLALNFQARMGRAISGALSKREITERQKLKDAISALNQA